MESNRQDTKYLLRNNPLSLLINPKSWFSVLTVFFNVVWMRLKYVKESVYYSEASIDSICEKIGEPLGDVFSLMKCQSKDLHFLTNFRTGKLGDTNSIARLFNNRFKRYNQCFVLLVNGTPSSFLWTASRAVLIETTNFLYKLNDNCVAIYDVYTDPIFRKKGCYRKLLYLVLHEYKKAGFTYAGLWVMKHNYNAIKVQDSCGFSTISKEISYSTFIGFKRNNVRKVNYHMSDLLS